ncbi:MAG: RpiB/LacA/LacB family sugar-phosphate isomerase [Planctomycetota bacterium]
MKIALGADHRGRETLLHITAMLGTQGHELLTVDQQDIDKSVDYPDTALPVARAVAMGEAHFGILVCGSGIGSCITANKVRGIRAAQVHDEIGAEMARRHHDANILCLAADLMGHRTIERVVETFFATDFEGGRHARRIGKITAIEEVTTRPAASG